ncbi:MAG: hypothetical protein KC912_03180 [Proteobacteria bacterium]|nr:hypothetical protein [Pseudomonadota bacterium]
MSDDEQVKGSILPLVAWTGISLLTFLSAAGGVLLGVMDSESAGVMAAMLGCPVMAVAAAMFLGAVVTQLVTKSTVARIIAPIGVAVIGGGVGGLLTGMFFAVLWPML